MLIGSSFSILICGKVCGHMLLKSFNVLFMFVHMDFVSDVLQMWKTEEVNPELQPVDYTTRDTSSVD